MKLRFVNKTTRNSSSSLKLIIVVHLSFGLPLTLSDTNEKRHEDSEDYCQFDIFQPRCLKNEVLQITSARYGRMSVGRCLTAEEVEAHRSTVGDDPRYFGCSVDVMPTLTQKCSGKVECDVRMSDITSQNVKPCFPGLVSYLEVSYACITVADEERSCSVGPLLHPIHIIISSDSRRICGTKSQPWNVEAPLGQKIRLALLDFTLLLPDQRPTERKQPCLSYGVIVDKTIKRNITMCKKSNEKEQELYLSSGNAVDLVLDSPVADIVRQFAIRVEAVGCSDLIPPEDAWLKRNDDQIVIGCYSNRQTWHLRCEGEKWTGVFGNCSHGYSELFDRVLEPETKAETWSNEQIVGMVAVGGFTVTLTLVILCIGIVCLRRFSAQDKKNQDYKTLNFHHASVRNQQTLSGATTGFGGIGQEGTGTQSPPTYSVYVGHSGFN